MDRGGRSAEERLARLVELQGLLATVARDIGPATELEPVLATVLRAMRKLVEFRGGSVQLVDHRGLYVAAADPPVSPDVRAARLPVGEGLGGRVVSTGEPVFCPDLDDDPRVDPALRRMGSNAEMRSFLAVPLVVLGEVIGLMQVDSAEPDAFDEDDRAVLEGLAAQVAGAIESARRHQHLREVEAMKTDFIARVSHELRTPLTIMAGFTETLIQHGPDLPADRQREVLQRVQASISRLTRLIEDILAVSSLEAGVSRAQPEQVDLAVLLQEVRQSAFDPGRVAIARAAGTAVLDPALIRHGLGLLVDNALKYGGDAELAAEVEPGESGGPGPVVFLVRDHGPGIPSDDRNRAFERFWRGSHTGAGMGLGLPVVRQLASTLGGSVTYDDAPGGGALLTLRVPQLAL